MTDHDDLHDDARGSDPFADVPPEVLAAWAADTAAMPVDLPSAAELDAMFRALGQPDPFAG